MAGTREGGGDWIGCPVFCFRQVEGWALGLRFVLNVLGRDDCAGN